MSMHDALPMHAPFFTLPDDSWHSHLSRASGFNNGCDIGSEKCDGITGQAPGTNAAKFRYTGSGEPPNWGSEGIVTTWKGRFPRPKFLKYPERNATNCDPRSRTINVNAECGSPEDFYFYMPWRYPGISPVTDSCGGENASNPHRNVISGEIPDGFWRGFSGRWYPPWPGKRGRRGSDLH